MASKDVNYSFFSTKNNPQEGPLKPILSSAS